MRSNLIEPVKGTDLFRGLSLQTGGWLELALMEAGLPEAGEDSPDAPQDRNEAAALIAARWLADGAIERAWEEATETERTVLRAGLTDGPVSRGTLIRHAGDRGNTPAQVEQALIHLERRALLLPAGGPASAAYQVPQEVTQRIRALLREETPDAEATPPASSIIDQASAFVDDFTTILAYLRRGAYRVTRGGVVHAADLRRVAATLEIPEDISAADSPDASPNQEGLFPTRLGLILELAANLHLVISDANQIHVDAKRARTWLGRSVQEVHRDLVRAAFRSGWRYAAEVSALGGFLRDYAPNTWFQLGDIAGAMESAADFIELRPADLRQRLRHAATYLCWLGVAAVSPEETHPGVVALTELGARLLRDPEEVPAVEPASLVILPNFEILLPQTADLATRWQLETFCEPGGSSRGPMRTYRLERGTLLAAMKCGVVLEDVLDFLEDRCGGDIPENVRISLRDWSQSYGAYYFMQPTLLVCRDAAAAAAARTVPRIADRVLGMLTDEILILQPEATDVVRNQLEIAGWMPRPGVKRLPIGGSLSGEVVDGGGVPTQAARKRSRSTSPSRHCGIERCERPHTARGLCATHYQQARRGRIGFPDA